MARLSWEAIRKSLGIPEATRPDRDSDTEVAAELGMPATASSTAEGYETASGDGVSVSPVPITKGQRVTVIYEGVLARQGAKAVVLHYGIGPGDWRHVRDVPMVETAPGRFEASLEVPMDGRLEFCFRDGAYNWDNNSGRNWSYIIHSGGGSLA